MGQLERLRGSLDPATLFQTVPGIGPKLAARIYDALGVETLEALEVACHEGRLGEVTGVGRRRVAAIRAALAEILDRSRLRRRPVVFVPAEPPVDVLLDVDREYLDKACTTTLPTIAPRRFNPERKAWLPVLHTTRGDWHSLPCSRIPPTRTNSAARTIGSSRSSVTMTTRNGNARW